MKQEKTQEFFPARNIRSDEVYTSSDIRRLLKIGDETLTQWYRLGLPYTPVSLAPKAKRLVYGAKLIEFLDAYGLALRIISFMGLSHGEEETEEETEG